jgi:hypothetical protein
MRARPWLRILLACFALALASGAAADHAPSRSAREVAVGGTLHGGGSNAASSGFVCLGYGVHADGRFGRIAVGARADFGVETVLILESPYRFLSIGAGPAWTSPWLDRSLMLVVGTHHVREPDGVGGGRPEWTRELPFAGLRFVARSPALSRHVAATLEVAVLRDVRQVEVESWRVGGTTVLATVGFSAVFRSR